MSTQDRASCTNCPSIKSDLICPNAKRFRGQIIGDGHCVSLIKRCTGAPSTMHWRAGSPVLGNTLEPGSIIATFEGGRYPNRRGHHAAIYIEQDENGIWVWDQWVGKAVHKRLIRWRDDSAPASNTAQAYRVVTIDEF